MRAMELFINNPIEDKSDTEAEDNKLTQANLDELPASFSNWAPNLTTSDHQFKWVNSQDVQIIQNDRDPTLGDYIVTIHCKYSNPIRMHHYPLAQAKDLFPTLIAWHVFMMSGSNETDPELCWAIDHWRSITAPNLLGNNMDVQHNLNILSNVRTHASNKIIKLTYLSTELIVDIR